MWWYHVAPFFLTKIGVTLQNACICFDSILIWHTLSANMLLIFIVAYMKLCNYEYVISLQMFLFVGDRGMLVVERPLLLSWHVWRLLIQDFRYHTTMHQYCCLVYSISKGLSVQSSLLSHNKLFTQTEDTRKQTIIVPAALSSVRSYSLIYFTFYISF